MKEKKEKNNKIKYLVLLIGAVLVANILLVGPTLNLGEHGSHHMGEEREDFIHLKENIIGELIKEGDYSCCLKKPCTYCIEKTPGHGEGATCDCLGDIMNGVHPCGECIGEIMEGHGNPYLSEHFAKAIAEKVGPEFEDELSEMMDSLYG